jgi:hypothetical protein
MHVSETLCAIEVATCIARTTRDEPTCMDFGFCVVGSRKTKVKPSLYGILEIFLLCRIVGHDLCLCLCVDKGSGGIVNDAKKGCDVDSKYETETINVFSRLSLTSCRKTDNC